MFLCEINADQSESGYTCDKIYFSREDKKWNGEFMFYKDVPGILDPANCGGLFTDSRSHISASTADLHNSRDFFNLGMIFFGKYIIYYYKLGEIVFTKHEILLEYILLPCPLSFWFCEGYLGNYI